MTELSEAKLTAKVLHKKVSIFDIVCYNFVNNTSWFLYAL